MNIITMKNQTDSLITFNQSKSNNNKIFFIHYFIYVLREFVAKNLLLWTNWRLNSGKLNSYALRFLFAYGIGFTDRKLRLSIFDVGQYFSPNINALKITKINKTDILLYLTKTAKWMQNNSKITEKQMQILAIESESISILNNNNKKIELLTKIENKNLNKLIKGSNKILQMD